MGSGAFLVLPVSNASLDKSVKYRHFVGKGLVRSSCGVAMYTRVLYIGHICGISYEYMALNEGTLWLCSYSTTVATTESSRHRFYSERSRLFPRHVVIS